MIYTKYWQKNIKIQHMHKIQHINTHTKMQKYKNKQANN